MQGGGSRVPTLGARTRRLDVAAEATKALDNSKNARALVGQVKRRPGRNSPERNRVCGRACQAREGCLISLK